MPERPIAPRLRRLPRCAVLGRRVAVAVGWRSRLLGLAFLDRREAGPGLLIPGCASVHTFGMRFALDVVFLDAAGGVLEERFGVLPRRVISRQSAAAVLELPAGRGRVRASID